MNKFPPPSNPSHEHSHDHSSLQSHDFELTAYATQRRTVLKLMAASAALASGACSGPPNEKIVPFVHAPEESLPGKPLFYASSVSLSGYGMGVLVEANEGRPTKIEGNPLHAASLGSTDMFAQAQILQLWDPARSQAPLHRSQITTWPQFLAAMQSSLKELEATQGDGLALLTGNICSPTMQMQLMELQKRFPRMRWHQYDPLHRDNELHGAKLAFGRALDTNYHFDKAAIVLTLDADFLSGAPTSVRYARDFATLRNPDHGAMSRIYSLESFPGLIGAKADHRLAMTPASIERALFRIAHAFNLSPGATGDVTDFERLLIADFKSHLGASVVVPGTSLSAEAHALVHLLNHRLGGQGKTFSHIESVAFEPESHLESIATLSKAIEQKKIQMLVMLGGNPAYDAPSDLAFDEKIKTIPTTVHISSYVDETSSLCTWHIPQAHALEQWSDVRAFDGTASIVQPVIAPLYNGRSFHDILNVLLGKPERSAYETVRAQWNSIVNENDGEQHWRSVLREGVIRDSQAQSIAITPHALNISTPHSHDVDHNASMTVNFIADQSVRDGQFANNAWLQEIPRSMSKLTWDNAAYISPRTAERLNLATGDEIELRRANRSVRAGVWVLPGHADDCMTLPLGYGRTHAGAVGNNVGFNAYQLRTLDAPWNGAIAFSRTGKQQLLVTTQHHSKMEGRDIIRSATFAEFERNASFATATEEQRIPKHTLYPDYPYEGYKWGMSIDLNACIGCNACTIACQAENNIPSVGKTEVHRGREMHWIRIDRYYREDNAIMYTDFQPVPCMHCERAPCEEVCPVGATVHDSQGLNLQVYNRCVGTRFCSNNCPYKVRRFNFLQYSNQTTESLKAGANPEVTVRQRGVMEKCTYCIQRIQRGRIEAEQLGRKIRDGEVVAACQAACPTQAIVFGDLNDVDSKVRAAKASPRNYALLAELNTHPRTTYLAQVTNPTRDIISKRDDA